MGQSPVASEIYRHTQFGTVIVAASVIALVGCLAIGSLAGWPLVVVAVMILMAALPVLFHSLTAVVTPEHLRIAFGPGLVSKTIPMAEIQSAEPARGSLPWGWGIRYWPGRGWMWNVSGFDVVVLGLPEGRQFRVGTDDPEGLAFSIRQAKAAGL